MEMAVSTTKKDLSVYRKLLVYGGAIYMGWWFAVEYFLPHSFNPVGSRIFVATYPSIVTLLSFHSNWIRKHIQFLFLAFVWILTTHYFYLFYYNSGDINWIVGCYITVFALNLFLFSEKSLLVYSIFVTLLSALMLYLLPDLKNSVFLPGIITIALQANIGLYSRQKIIKRAEEERLMAATMAENVRLRDEFISIASHELRTPLASLKLKSQVYGRTMAKDPKFHSAEKTAELLSFIEKQGHRLTRLVDSMLDVSRISAGRFEMELETIDLAIVLKESVDAVRLSLKPTGPLTTSIPDTLPLVADPLRVEQVIENLLTNAIKYGNSRPIQISLKQEEQFAELVVTDQGIGIAPDYQERIFRRFERAVSSQHISGLGLGLYIAKQIVTAHGGTITVVSDVGKGAAFTMRLPIRI